MENKKYFNQKSNLEKSNSSFAHKIRHKKQCVLFELVPPDKNNEQSDIEKSTSLVVSIHKNLPTDAINIPEVRAEKRDGEKVEPRIISSYLHSAGFSDVIINKPVVYLPWNQQKHWLKETYNNNSIRNFVLVGGESSKTSYPGLSVVQAAQAITKAKHEFPDILLGGITIPTRGNEAQRVLQKSIAGIEFFTTQILYESASIKQFLQDYWNLCLENNIDAKTICLSFAPVTSEKDIELLSRLGVKIPEETHTELTSGWLGIGYRSLNISKNILDDVFQFMIERDIKIPIGLNIGYVNRRNFEFSITFLEQMAAFYLENNISENKNRNHSDILEPRYKPNTLNYDQN